MYRKRGKLREVSTGQLNSERRRRGGKEGYMLLCIFIQRFWFSSSCSARGRRWEYGWHVESGGETERPGHREITEDTHFCIFGIGNFTPIFVLNCLSRCAALRCWCICASYSDFGCCGVWLDREKAGEN